MTPRFPLSNAMDVGAGSPVIFCNSTLRSGVVSYCTHLFFSKLSSAAASRPPSFFNRIVVVIAARSRELVVRAAAGRSVTVVTSVQPFRDRTDVQLVRKTVGKNIPPFTPDYTVSVRCAAGCPQPTARHRLHGNLFFKSLFQGFSGILTDRHLNPPYRVNVLRALRKLLLPLRPIYYSTKEVRPNEKAVS
jgi:hypothetical protein